MNSEDKDDMLRTTPIRGSNQTTVRGVNARLILHIIRQYGTLTKAEATRATGLSPNAVSMIFNALEADGYLLRGDPIRGRVGQPSVPMRLNPAARHYLGLKIGRRSFDLVVADFSGGVVARRTLRHRYPTPERTVAFLQTELRPLLRSARLRKADIDGSSVAMPSELWHWTDDFDAPSTEMAAWHDFSAAVDLAGLLPGPISVENDGTAACRAELVFGPSKGAQDSIYFFVGTLIDGGIVLNGSVFPGKRGNSGGFGPMRIPDEPGGQRLVDHASIALLERMVRDAGSDPELLHDGIAAWNALEPAVGAWIARAGRSLAHAIVSTLAVIDFEAVVIDGALPDAIRTRLVCEVDNQLGQLDLQGIYRPRIGAGHFGSVARALGAAAYWISTDFMVDQNTLLRKAAPV